jgi:hypothetical protein
MGVGSWWVHAARRRYALAAGRTSLLVPGHEHGAAAAPAQLAAQLVVVAEMAQITQVVVNFHGGGGGGWRGAALATLHSDAPPPRDDIRGSRVMSNTLSLDASTPSRCDHHVNQCCRGIQFIKLFMQSQEFQV